MPVQLTSLLQSSRIYHTRDREGGRQQLVFALLSCQDIAACSMPVLKHTTLLIDPCPTPQLFCCNQSKIAAGHQNEICSHFSFTVDAGAELEQEELGQACARKLVRSHSSWKHEFVLVEGN